MAACRRRVLLRAWLAAGLGAACGSAPAYAQSEVRVKARLTANLARFTQWPGATFASASDPLVLCAVTGQPALAAAFEELNGVMLGSRRCRILINPGAIGLCQVLYVDAQAEPGAGALLSQAAGAAVLTVGDGADFARRGMIELVNVNDAMRFDVDLGRMRRSQLDLQSQALHLARRVED